MTPRPYWQRDQNPLWLHPLPPPRPPRRRRSWWPILALGVALWGGMFAVLLCL
jgi:hypothetical protein